MKTWQSLFIGRVQHTRGEDDGGRKGERKTWRKDDGKKGDGRGGQERKTSFFFFMELGIVVFLIMGFFTNIITNGQLNIYF